MDRRRFLNLSSLALGASVVTPLIAGCRRGDPLRLSYHPWVGYETLYLAERFGWLPESVSLTRRRSASESLSALQADEADAAALTLDEVIRARLAGSDLVVAMVFNVSAGADAVVVHESIQRIDQLRGKRIAVETSAVGSVLLDHVLERGGLDRIEVSVVDVPADRHLAVWEAGEVDAVVTYEPALASLLDAGAVRFIDSRDFPDLIFDTLAVRSSRLGDVKHVLPGLIDAHFSALEHLSFNRQDALYRIADVQGVTTEDVRRALAGVQLPDRRANHRYLEPGSRLIEAANGLNRRFGGDELGTDWFTDEFLPARTPRDV